MADHLQNEKANAGISTAKGNQRSNERIKVAGHLAEVRGIFHMKLTWTDEDGKRQRKSISTGLVVRGNKKRAEEILRETRKEQEVKVNLQDGKRRPEDMLFADFMEEWLEVVRPEVKLTTFGGYQMNVQKAIGDYCRVCRRGRSHGA